MLQHLGRLMHMLIARRRIAAWFEKRGPKPKMLCAPIMLYTIFCKKGHFLLDSEEHSKCMLRRVTDIIDPRQDVAQCGACSGEAPLACVWRQALTSMLFLRVSACSCMSGAGGMSFARLSYSNATIALLARVGQSPK